LQPGGSQLTVGLYIGDLDAPPLPLAPPLIVVGVVPLNPSMGVPPPPLLLPPAK
jgi:hypothetical protein